MKYNPSQYHRIHVGTIDSYDGTIYRSINQLISIGFKDMYSLFHDLMENIFLGNFQLEIFYCSTSTITFFFDEPY